MKKKKVMTILASLAMASFMAFGVAAPTTAHAEEAVTEEQQASITVDDDFVVLTGEDDTQRITASTDSDEAITFTSSNTEVAEVTSKGKIISVAPGLCDITVSAGDVSETVSVTVVPEKKTERHVKLSVQMYNFSVKLTNGTHEDVINALRRLAAAGYEGVEWANIGGYSAAKDLYGFDQEELKSIMDELGLETDGIHYHTGWLETDELCEQAVAECQAMGTDKLIYAYSTPKTFGIEPDENGNWTAEQLDQWAEKINEVITRAQKAAEGTDVQVIYHNHGPEMYTCTNGKSVLENVTADAYEFDFYWASRGLGSVDAALDYLKAHQDQIFALHMKDGKLDCTQSGDYTTWGAGEFDLQSILDVARDNAGIEWAVVENDGVAWDTSIDSVADAEQSASVASNLNFTYVHKAGKAVKENVKAATYFKKGSYEKVTYCKDCGEEMSRVKVTTAAKKAVLSSVKAGKASAVVTAKKIKGAAGYQVQYSTSKTFAKAKTVKSTSAKVTIKKLKKGQRYYVRVRAYAKSGKSSWSSAKSVKIRK